MEGQKLRLPKEKENGTNSNIQSTVFFLFFFSQIYFIYFHVLQNNSYAIAHPDFDDSYSALCDDDGVHLSFIFGGYMY